MNEEQKQCLEDSPAKNQLRSYSSSEALPPAQKTPKKLRQNLDLRPSKQKIERQIQRPSGLKKSDFYRQAEHFLKTSGANFASKYMQTPDGSSSLSYV